MFNSAQQNPPLVVPEPLALQRKHIELPPDTPQVQVRNFLAGALELPKMAQVFCNRDGLHAQFLGPLELPGPNGFPLAGVVISQQPPAGTMVPVGSVVSLTIGDYKDRRAKKLGRRTV